MDLRRLEIFAKVAELGSFSRAAEALFLTQPTVSEHIRSLEEELGVQLLDRLGRGTTPTRAGQLLLGYAQRMLALGREARQAMDRFQGRVLGELVVGGSTIPGEYVLPELVGRFKRKYPEISICLLIGSSRQVTEWLEESRVEVGVVGARPAGRALAVVAPDGGRAGGGDERRPPVGPARDDHPRRAARRADDRPGAGLRVPRGPGARPSRRGPRSRRLPRGGRDRVDAGRQAGGPGRASGCRWCPAAPWSTSAGWGSWPARVSTA